MTSLACLGGAILVLFLYWLGSDKPEDTKKQTSTSFSVSRHDWFSEGESMRRRRGEWATILATHREGIKLDISNYNLKIENMEKVTWENIRVGGVYKVKNSPSVGEVRVMSLDGTAPCTRQVKDMTDCHRYRDLSGLERVEPKFEKGYLFPGDYVHDKSDNSYAKVLEVGDLSFQIGSWEYSACSRMVTHPYLHRGMISGPDRSSFSYDDINKDFVARFTKNRQDVPVKEMTLKEVCEKLGEEIKITK